ncbi:molybdenum cofactor biosynthesis protein B [Alphaproteobacteria bacterium]|jgi:molybdopterin adenylyltransferase|nr:molybdenum cofactor biosynthesis protein B [Alphaproteobacteria bacterium]MBT5798360.1 molybdenum cofactor biosynthesis protein B [Alphaproteobacteria bacterium]MDA9815907.1 molybdenum cofactor biosynthesis protein B [Alphaproteobacteria bacterium]MDC0462450.1 molybdenum cofactor biosynthesis protein B [Alphaproteobacteria bacterium]MDC3311855.1 molybdenum cofactor biosynthesis protein B [Alphaproteobacteria bacterium]
MSKLDLSRDFIPVKIAVLTISDTRSLSDDKSGDLLAAKLTEAGHILVKREITQDDVDKITKNVTVSILDTNIDVVISTGGTGLTGRDVTPEAFRSVFDKEIEGFGEMFRYLSFQKIGTSTLQSRAVAGVAGGTYLFALPGSPSACRDAWDDLLVHQLDYRHRPCNFVEIMPRLLEAGVASR